MGEIFFLVACQYDREDEELLNANLASWLHLAAGTDAGKVERLVRTTGHAGKPIMLNRTSKNVHKLHDGNVNWHSSNMQCPVDRHDQ